MPADSSREDTLALLGVGVGAAGALGLALWALAGPDLECGVRAGLSAAGLVLGVLAALHWRLLQRTRRLQAAAQAAQQAAAHAQANLSATLDILPDGLAVYDADDRLELCNARYREVAPGITLPLEYGTPFEDVLRRIATTGEIIDAEQGIDAWLASRMARHRAPSGPQVQQVRGDRWMRITERALEGGGVVILRTDITDTVHRERALEQALQGAERAERRLREAVNAMPAGLEIYDEDDRLVLCNDQMTRWRPHLPAKESLGKTYEELLRDGLRHGIPEVEQGQEELWLAHEMALRGHRSGPEIRHYPNGLWMHMHERRTPSGMTVCVRLDISDLIEQRQKLEAARQESQRAWQLLERAVEALPVSIEIFDDQDRLVLYNQQLSRMYPHMNYAEHLGQRFVDILRYSVDRGLIPSAHGREEAWIAERMAEHGHRKSNLVQRLADGRWINIYETRTPENYVVAVRLDITDLIEQREALEAAQQQAQQARQLLQDAVEALPECFALFDADDRLVICNAQYRRLYPISPPMMVAGSPRRRFDDRLATEWLRCGRHHLPLCVILIDIDHFKLYNDHYGHLAGDECLRRVAQLLQACTRRADEVAARFGGEEFVLLLPDVGREAAVAVAQRCMQSLREAALTHARSPTAPVITFSMGIASMVPRADAASATLVQAADAALYRAKSGGRNRFEVFDPEP